MDKFVQFIIDWANSNPVFVLILFCFIIFVPACFLLLAMVAFFQGREVSFWPPKIGKKLEILAISNGEVSLSGLAQELSSAHAADAVAIQQVRAELRFLGVSSQFLYTRESFVEVLTDRKIKMKILLLNPFSEHARMLENMENLPVVENITTSARNMYDIARFNSNINIRFYDEVPYFRIMLVDRSCCLVSFYSEKRNNPQLMFCNNEKNQSFISVYDRMFETIWEKSIGYDSVFSSEKDENAKIYSIDQ